MRNIYLIQTDKPSRLVKIKETYFLTTSTDIPAGVFYNIYIISDEIPTEGDALMRTDTSRVFCTLKGANPSIVQKYCRKIILTSDHSLEGVQQIDDEFLEWFVKNPSCEYVEINDWLDNNDNIAFNGKARFQLIIPKEESVDFLGRTSFDSLKQEAIEAEMDEYDKQETLEEAAENSDKSKCKHFRREHTKIEVYDSFEEGFIAGAKWQAERLCDKVDYISFVHLQNLNGRETVDETFDAGIIAGVMETEKRMYSEEEVRNIAEISFSFYRTNEFTDQQLEVEWRNWLEKKYLKRIKHGKI